MRWTLLLPLALIAAVILPHHARAETDAQRRLRIACMQAGDMSEPADIMLARRCHGATATRPAAKPVGPIFGQLYSNEPRALIKPGTEFTSSAHPVNLTPGAPGPNRPNAAYGLDTCPQGLVWRERVPGDHLCVTPDQRHR